MCAEPDGRSGEGVQGPPGDALLQAGPGLDTFRMVALTKNFAKLEASVLQAAYAR